MTTGGEYWRPCGERDELGGRNLAPADYSVPVAAGCSVGELSLAGADFNCGSASAAGSSAGAEASLSVVSPAGELPAGAVVEPVSASSSPGADELSGARTLLGPGDRRRSH